MLSMNPCDTNSTSIIFLPVKEGFANQIFMYSLKVLIFTPETDLKILIKILIPIVIPKNLATTLFLRIPDKKIKKEPNSKR